MRPAPLRESSQFSNAFLLTSRDGSIVKANTVAEQLLGYASGELPGLQIDAFLPEKDQKELARLVEEALDNPPPDHATGTVRTQALAKDGQWVPIEIALGPTAGSTCAISFHDISLTEALERRPNPVEQRFQIAASQTSDIIQYVNVDQDWYIWYSDIDEIMGYEPGQFPRTLSGWLELIHPDDRDRITTSVDEIAENGEPSWNLAYRIRAKDGSYRHWLDRGTVIGFLDGRSNEGIGAIIDQTEEVLARQELEQALTDVQELRNKLEAENYYLQHEIKTEHDFDEIIGRSPQLLEALSKTQLVSQTESTVLLLGETGTGKELLARAIHARSTRNDRPLIKVDCGTLPAGLIESELFGHEKGAFTGAHESKVGRFELADKGTIFLDEIGDLPMDLQPKLLRAIEDGVIQRVGGTEDQQIDVRVIAATNRDLEAEIDRGGFRSDLYYRLSVFPIVSPPLRERREDIALLVSFFVSRYSKKSGKTIESVAGASMDTLVAYDWPGNVRELRNVIERSVILCSGNVLDVTEVLGDVPSPSGARAAGLKRDLFDLERSRIVRALDESDWKIKGAGNAAERLGLPASTLRSRMKRLDIARPLPPASTP